MTRPDSQRFSVRAFESRPVPEALLHGILQAARSAPSGANLQPGMLLHVCGAARAALSTALIAAYRSGVEAAEDYDYFPRPMPQYLRRRQVAAAQALYSALGVERGDSAGRAVQFERNFSFFDAPVAMVVTIDRRFGAGGYMDLGMLLYGIMEQAHAAGLGSCAIGALASYPDIVRAQLGLDTGQAIVCGMAIGYADAHAPVNRTRTSRLALDGFYRVVDGAASS